MVTLEKILLTMIKAYEVEERLRRDDFAFDAFEHLSKKIGHKNSSTLRKMCGPSSSRSGAKLGVEDAITLMDEMNDYRLLEYMRQQMSLRKQQSAQLGLFTRQQTEL